MMTLIIYFNLILSNNNMKVVQFVLGLVLVCESVYVRKFTYEMEVGSAEITTASGIVSGGDKYNLLATIPLLIAKANNLYDIALSHTNLEILMFNSQFSFKLEVKDKAASSFTMNIDCECNLSWKLLSIRHLTVNSNFTTFVEIVTINKDYKGAGRTIQSGNTFVQKTGLVNTYDTSTTTVAIVLQSLEISNLGDPKDVDIYLSSSFTKTVPPQEITVTVTNILTATSQVEAIGFSIILIDQAKIQASFGMKFYTKLEQFGGKDLHYLVDTTTTFYSDTVFWGLRNIHNLQNMIKFNFELIDISTIKISSLGIYAYDNFVAEVINFMVTPCSIAQPYYNVGSLVCVNVCPNNTYLLNTTSECIQCSIQCLSCSTSSTNCTQCLAGQTLSNNTCLTLTCPSTCTNCTSSTTCLTCITDYELVNSSCILNCSSIENCLTCSSVNGAKPCDSCQVEYVVFNGGCVPKCGDGLILVGENCDDGDLESGDGCSSACIIEEYFTCTNLTSTSPSVCSLSSVKIELQSVEKVKNENSFISVFNLFPRAAVFSNINWQTAFSLTSPSTMNILSIQYDEINFQMIVKGAYNENSNNKQLDFMIDFSNQSSTFSLTNSSVLSLFLVSSKGVPFHFYTKSQYSMGQVIEIMSMIMGVLCLLTLIAGYFGGKIIVLEQIAIVQITWISLLTVKQPVVTFEALQFLKLSFGYNKLQEYDQSLLIDPNIRLQQLSPNPLLNYGISLTTIIVPLLIALIIKLKSLSQANEIKKPTLNYKKILNENTYYGLMFCSYIVMLSVAIDIKLFKTGITKVYIGLVIGSLILVMLVMMTIIFYRMKNKYLGQFKRKFKRLEISQYYYAFLFIERCVSSVIICMTDSLAFGLFVEMGILGVQMVFIIYQQPYINGEHYRPIFCLAITEFILLLMAVNNMTFIQNEKNSWSVYIPLVICAALVVSMVISIKYLVFQIKEKYFVKKEQAKINDENVMKSGQEPKKQKQKQISQIIEESENVQYKNDTQIKIFENRLFQNNEDLKRLMNSTICHTPGSNNINEEWQNYHILSQRQLLSEIRQKIKNVDKIEQNL